MKTCSRYARYLKPLNALFLRLDVGDKVVPLILCLYRIDKGNFLFLLLFIVSLLHDVYNKPLKNLYERHKI